MGKVLQPTQAPTFVPGKTNTIISVTEVKTLAVAWVDGEGKRQTALVLAFGKDVEDGGIGVFVMADEQQMVEQLRIANPTLKKGVRKFFAQEGGVTPEEASASAAADVGGEDGGTGADPLGADVGGDDAG